MTYIQVSFSSKAGFCSAGHIYMYIYSFNLLRKSVTDLEMILGSQDEQLNWVICSIIWEKLVSILENGIW